MCAVTVVPRDGDGTSGGTHDVRPTKNQTERIPSHPPPLPPSLPSFTAAFLQRLSFSPFRLTFFSPPTERNEICRARARSCCRALTKFRRICFATAILIRFVPVPPVRSRDAAEIPSERARARARENYDGGRTSLHSMGFVRPRRRTRYRINGTKRHSSRQWNVALTDDGLVRRRSAQESMRDAKSKERPRRRRRARARAEP